MKTNPPIKGHELILEGKLRRTHWGDVNGGCRCGAKPENVDNEPSAAEVKRWHRKHKDDVRKASR